MPLWGILGQNPKIQNTGHFSPVLSLLPGVDAIPCRYALIQAHMAHIAGVGDGSLRYGAGNAIQSVCVGGRYALSGFPNIRS